jgi:hypothetical protein
MLLLILSMAPLNVTVCNRVRAASAETFLSLCVTEAMLCANCDCTSFKGLQLVGNFLQHDTLSDVWQFLVNDQTVHGVGLHRREALQSTDDDVMWYVRASCMTKRNENAEI